jgi:putative aminopeptidase FrvX
MHDGEFLILLKECLAIPAPAGREEQMAEWVCRKIAEADLVPEVDPAGNVIVSMGGQDSSLPEVVMAAHLDEIGMVVTAVGDDGNLSITNSGGLFPWKIGESPVDVIGDAGRVPGVLSMGSTHNPDAANQSLAWKNLTIMTGCTRPELARRGIRTGSSVVPSAAVRGPVVLGEGADPLVGCWTFDDRAGVVSLIRLIWQLQAERRKPVYPLKIAFTVHEEGGCHGAKVLALREKPEIFIAVDGAPLNGSDLLLDGRPGCWSKDKIGHYDQRLIRSFIYAADKAGTSMQVAVYENAMSDASAVYNTGAVPRVGILGHVRTNSHGFEVARLSVFENLLKTLRALVEMTL